MTTMARTEWKIKAEHKFPQSMTAFKFIVRFDVDTKKKKKKFNANEFHLLRDLHFKSAFFAHWPCLFTPHCELLTWQMLDEIKSQLVYRMF